GGGDVQSVSVEMLLDLAFGQRSGDRAHGRSARASSRLTATHVQIRDDGSRNVWIVSGVYEDEFVREARGWRIRKRVTIAPYEEGEFLADGVREFASPPSLRDLR